MNNYPSEVKQTLWDIIDDMSSIAWAYSTKPGHSFMRSGKLGFSKTMKLIVSMEGGTVNEEMMEFFNCDLTSAPTQSAFSQQRALIKHEAFYDLFRKFTDHYYTQKTIDGYSILAVDGSHVVYATNPAYKDDYVIPRKEGDKGYNQLHLNALYDINTKCYVDAVIQPGVKQDERAALHSMIDSYEPEDPLHTIITVDRGYESFDLLGHLHDRNLRYLMRVKDYNSYSSILTSFRDVLPETDEFDITIKRFITRSRSLKSQSFDSNVYHYIRPQKNFRSLPPEENGLYLLQFRVVRVKISEDSYECLLTNLPRNEFSDQKLKELYHSRWDIETSFRHLKYAIGMVSFHSKKVEYIKQEIFAKLTLFNFASFITAQASNIKNSGRKKKHNYKINYTMAAKICHKFLKMSASMPIPDVIGWIERFLSVHKNDDRHFIRTPRGIGACSFFYRIA